MRLTLGHTLTRLLPAPRLLNRFEPQSIWRQPGWTRIHSQGSSLAEDRLFFFANYEDFIEHDGNQLVTASVPSSAERSGDFSELLGSNPNPVQLYNPFYTTYDSRAKVHGRRYPTTVSIWQRTGRIAVIDPGAAAIQQGALAVAQCSEHAQQRSELCHLSKSRNLQLSCRYSL